MSENNNEYRIDLILSGIRNLLEQNNPNGVNDHLIQKINVEKGIK